MYIYIKYTASWVTSLRDENVKTWDLAGLVKCVYSPVVSLKKALIYWEVKHIQQPQRPTEVDSDPQGEWDDWNKQLGNRPFKTTKDVLVGGWTTHLKNMLVKMGNLPQIGMKIKNIWVATTKDLPSKWEAIASTFVTIQKYLATLSKFSIPCFAQKPGLLVTFFPYPASSPPVQKPEIYRNL